MKNPTKHNSTVIKFHMKERKKLTDEEMPKDMNTKEQQNWEYVDTHSNPC